MPDDQTDATADVDATDVDDATEVEHVDDTDDGAGDGKDAKQSDGKTPKIDGEFDPDRAARLIQRLRKEAAAEKAARRTADEKAQSTFKAVAQVLGLAEDDKLDPEKLTAQLEEARASERQRRTELQVLRLAPNLGADADALLDSQAFAKAIRDIDPASGTFRDDVEDAIRDHLTKYPRHKASTVKTAGADDAGEKKTPAPKKPEAGKSGADMNGAAGKARQVTAAELAKMTPQEIVAAQEKGLLDSLLSGS